MLSKLGVEATNNAFHDIQRCIIKSMLAVQKLVTNSPNSFELYGFDFIFDSNGKAWLLEVNGGPSMTANTKEDSELKTGLIDDVMTVINVEGMYFLPDLVSKETKKLSEASISYIRTKKSASAQQPHTQLCLAAKIIELTILRSLLVLLRSDWPKSSKRRTE
jgi:hypothetical protein